YGSGKRRLGPSATCAILLPPQSCPVFGEELSGGPPDDSGVGFVSEVRRKELVGTNHSPKAAVSGGVPKFSTERFREKRQKLGSIARPGGRLRCSFCYFLRTFLPWDTGRIVKK